jgi:hypothetical protein
VDNQSDTRLARRLEAGLRRRPGEDGSHAGACRLRREGIGGAGTQNHRGAEQRIERPDDRPDVAGIPHAVQVEAGGRRALRPLQGPDRDHASARPEHRDVGEQLRLDLLAFEAGPRRDQDEPGLDPRRQSRLEEVLTLGGEQVLTLAMLALAQFADQLQLLVVGALDHRVILLVVSFLSGGFFSWNEKAGRNSARPGERNVGAPSGGRTLPG